jgi:hypothetical protein
MPDYGGGGWSTLRESRNANRVTGRPVRDRRKQAAKKKAAKRCR